MKNKKLTKEQIESIQRLLSEPSYSAFGKGMPTLLIVMVYLAPVLLLILFVLTVLEVKGIL